MFLSKYVSNVAINTYNKDIFQVLFNTLQLFYLLTLNEKPMIINRLSANITKWSNTLKNFVGKLPRSCLSMFEHFVGLALKGLNIEHYFLTLFYSNSPNTKGNVHSISYNVLQQCSEPMFGILAAR